MSQFIIRKLLTNLNEPESHFIIVDISRIVKFNAFTSNQDIEFNFKD